MAVENGWELMDVVERYLVVFVEPKFAPLLYLAAVKVTVPVFVRLNPEVAVTLSSGQYSLTAESVPKENVESSGIVSP